ELPASVSGLAPRPGVILRSRSPCMPGSGGAGGAVRTRAAALETVSPAESQAQLHAPHRCQDTEDQAGVGIVSRIIRVLPVGAVEQVKCFHADLESRILLCQRSLEVELLPQRPVRRGEPIRRNRLRSPDAGCAE